ncbi:hypothetical protein EHS13_03050 [Paenibacillus psychroresistens]|uniref:Phage tail tape measure protein n=1 Tax=Paenibacillus psychroresistens TaxID=1778678 RepID=A0A6B8RE11_9BACL|nr:hypothetical protein [Paenibacillus psychroresistens]QGQ93954.1 hypothetical protein EHS13_03050 [Paenibacillus psychroresistens]
MATVGESLKLYDNLSKVMKKTQISIEATLNAAKRLRVEFEKRIVLDVNVTNAMKHIEKVKKHLSALSGAKNGTTIKVSLDTSHVLKQVSSLKSQIKDRIGSITAKLNIEVPKTLEKLMKNVNKSVKSPTTGLENIKPPGSSGTEKGMSKPNSKSSGVSLTGGALKMFGGIKNLVSGAIGHLGGGKQIISSTIGGAMEQQTTKDTINLRAGSEARGTAIFDQVSKQALKFGQNVEEAMSNTTTFMSNTKDPKQLTDLNQLAMRMAKLNPEEGSKGATAAIKSFMGGDSKDLEEKFNMKGSTVKNSGAMKAGISGDLQGFIKGMDKLLDQSGVTKAAFEKMVNGPAAQWQKATGNLKNSLTNAGVEAMNALGPLGEMINKAFESGKLQPFFDVLSNGLTLVVQGIVYLVEQAQWLFGVMQDNWPLVRAALLAVAAVITGVVLIALFEMAAGWLAAAWPILLIIAVVGLLIYAIQSFGVSTGQIVGVVFGVFGALFAYLYNCVAFIWNIFASFAEFLINLFIDPAYAVQKLFYDLAMTFLGHLYSMLVGVEDFAGGFMSTILKAINKVIEGLNWLGKAKARIFGGSFEPYKLLDETNVHAVSDQLKNMMNKVKAPTSDKNVVNVPKMVEKDLGDAFSSSKGAGKDLVDKLSSINMPKMSPDKSFKDPNATTKSLGADSTIGKVNEVGKIGETVDVSSEDLKVMRDLAEMKSIQNFVTLTPTVHITTGDIHEKADIQEIIRGIENTLAGSISTSAQGVYA